MEISDSINFIASVTTQQFEEHVCFLYANYLSWILLSCDYLEESFKK